MKKERKASIRRVAGAWPGGWRGEVRAVAMPMRFAKQNHPHSSSSMLLPAVLPLPTARLHGHGSAV